MAGQKKHPTLAIYRPPSMYIIFCAMSNRLFIILLLTHYVLN